MDIRERLQPVLEGQARTPQEILDRDAHGLLELGGHVGHDEGVQLGGQVAGRGPVLEQDVCLEVEGHPGARDRVILDVERGEGADDVEMEMRGPGDVLEDSGHGPFLGPVDDDGPAQGIVPAEVSRGRRPTENEVPGHGQRRPGIPP